MREPVTVKPSAALAAEGTVPPEPHSRGGRTSRREHTTALTVTVVLAAAGVALVAGTALAADHGGTHIELTGDDTWTVSREPVAVSGSSNRAPGTTILVELVRADGTAVLLAEDEVRGGTWNTTVDFSDVETGTYTLRATDGDTAASVRVEGVEALPTPAETPTADPTATPTADRGPHRDAHDTRADTGRDLDDGDDDRPDPRVRRWRRALGARDGRRAPSTPRIVSVTRVPHRPSAMTDAGADTDAIQCESCGTRVARGDAIRRETYGGLDPDRWQTLCCPDCGARLRTVLVGGE